MKFSQAKRRSRFKLIATVSLAGFLAVFIIGGFIVRKSYQENLKPVNSSGKTHVVTVASGATTGEIADTLKAKGVIRSDWAFEWYVRNHQVRDELKAGTYVIGENQSVAEIIEVLVGGKVATDLITFLPGKRIDQIRQTLIDNGFTAEDVDKALDPAQYAGHPALTDKPDKANLEGYIYPESFQKTAETTPADIIKLALDETKIRLTPDVRQAISKQGLTLHQGMILASIIEREVSRTEDRTVVAQVFYKRLKENIRLESNATDDYAKIDETYNSYKISGLPPGPISNMSETALQAVAFPAQTDWLYFVSGDDGQTHFSKTLEEHEALIVKYCTTACGR